MRVLITGGAGFIGSHLSEWFLKQKEKVIVIDNLITGRKQNIQEFLEDPNFEFIHHDICNRIEIKGDIDVVLHFASPASPKDYFKYPIQTMKTGALGTLNMLELAKEKKAIFFLASTSEVYGDPLQHPQTERYWGNVNPTGPRAVYDESKRFAEALTMAYHREFNLKIRIARIFNTYGPKMRTDDGRVIPNFITQALKNEPLTIYGDGKQTRSFCYISDMIKGMLRLLEKEIHEPVNLGNPKEITIIELAETIKKLTESKSSLRFLPMLPDDPKRRKPDISKAQKLLNWKPEVPLEEGLNNTISWFKEKASLLG